MRFPYRVYARSFWVHPDAMAGDLGSLSSGAHPRSPRGSQQAAKLISLALMVAVSPVAFWDLFVLATGLAH